MDMSVVEGEEQPANANEVTDYAAEIHSYLREMEVRIHELHLQLKVSLEGRNADFLLCSAQCRQAIHASQ